MPRKSHMRAAAAAQAAKAAPALDLGNYPTTWDEYVGQEQAKRMLRIAVKSAKMRKQPLGHILISHPSPGIGKTALAALVARDLGSTVRVVSGQVDADRARMIFSELKDNDCILYDEFHQVMDGGKKKAEWLLNYLQDGTLPGPRGAEVQPRVTVIAATTDAGKIPEAIVGRFPLQPPMSDYEDDEAAVIAQMLGRKVLTPAGLPGLHIDDADAIAEAGSNNPRAIRRLLTVLLDMAITEELPVVDGRYDVLGLLEYVGVTEDGLDPAAQDYLAALAGEFQGRAGAKALEDRLQQPGGLAGIERVLMDKGYLVKTNTGRVITQDGIARFRELVSA